MATILRKCLLMAFAMLTTTGLFAQSNKQAINILDKTASIIGHKGGRICRLHISKRKGRHHVRLHRDKRQQVQCHHPCRNGMV